VAGGDATEKATDGKPDCYRGIASLLMFDDKHLITA
jgi:hypothetical protein